MMKNRDVYVRCCERRKLLLQAECFSIGLGCMACSLILKIEA